ncbi:MAG: succinate dehydrogenase cytochrome b subunit [Phaeodactylibacter sp.]|uniref:succinate dehydrogenase cytochrome b subunit n=1 Tax=Phaeodactylibacter sp. TaxID=1940289 RepID=UPI0032ED7AA5
MSRNLFLRDSIVRKNLMALTGLFLCLFLVIHLAGNLQLLLPAEQAQIQYNLYSELLSHNILIKVVSYGLYASILAHAAYALLLTVKARQARGAQGYAYDKRGAVTPWYVRNMGVLGALLLAFIIIHMRDFWYQYKFTEMPMDAEGRKDLYLIVAAAYQQWWYVVLYVVSMLVLGFHLLHGFHSAFQTLGLYHSKYNRWVKWAGWGYSFLITAGFTIIPIYMYFTQNPLLP